jgi:putative transposase
MRTLLTRSTGAHRSIRRPRECISMARRPRGVRWGRARTQGARSNYKKFADEAAHEVLVVEPADHAIGRSRGGLTTKTHALVDGYGRPLALIVGPGQANDSPVLPLLLAEVHVAQRGPGRARTTPDAIRGDKAYSSRAHRALLRARGIEAVIPEPADQIQHRKNKGSGGGRPPACDFTDYKNRNVVERFFNRMKNWRGLASRYDKHAITYRGGVVLAAILTWLT